MTKLAMGHAMSDDLKEFARAVFNSQPFSQFVGAKLISVGPQTAEIGLPIVDQLIARAAANSAGKRQAVCQCEVFAIDGEEEQLCALAQGTVVRAGD